MNTSSKTCIEILNLIRDARITADTKSGNHILQANTSKSAVRKL
jgi:hypothetical protein